MVTTKPKVVKISEWLFDEVDKFVNKSKKNKTNFPSKRNFIDRAIIELLEKEGVKLDEK